jgi:hypothetical protein
VVLEGVVGAAVGGEAFEAGPGVMLVKPGGAAEFRRERIQKP